MNYIFFAVAVLCVLAGHCFRMTRWKSFVGVYEDVPSGKLLRSMALGYTTDLVLPFHIGDIVRACYLGKHLENKTSFSLATIIADRLLDVFIVTVLYLAFFLRGANCAVDLIVYTVFSLILVLLLGWALAFNTSIKKIVFSFSSIFNTSIQLSILSFMWSFVCTFKNMLHKINKGALFLRTVAMWLFYLLSYVLLGKAVMQTGTLTVFNEMFSFEAESSLQSAIRSGSVSKAFVYLLLFKVLTCVLLFVLSLIPTKKSEREAKLIIPYTSKSNRLDFLTVYFSNVRDSAYINSFLLINSDVMVLRNCSAGSNATTLLCMKNGEMIFRKYAFGDDAKKLSEQVRWIKDNSKLLYCTEITDYYYEGEICRYDMPYLAGSTGFFDYIHSASTEQSWKILMSAIDDLEKKYSGSQSSKADPETIAKYVKTKVIGNIDKIVSSAQFKQMSGYKEVVINQKTYSNLPVYMDKLKSEEFWISIFSGDYYSDIHGDLTIENIICNENYPSGYYLIDPNGGNIHNSPNLDYAKLLQSLHGNYEFLMHTDKVEVSSNRISFRMTRSTAYEQLYKKFKDYMLEKFGCERTKSIFFHEIIHWFRLMPYKINHDGNLANIFYAGMIIIINDIFKEFIEENEDK